MLSWEDIQNVGLEQILENVRVGNSGFNQEKREEIVDRVRSTYTAYSEATTTLKTHSQIEQEFKLKSGTVWDWRKKGRIPTLVTKYTSPLMPNLLEGTPLEIILENIGHNNIWENKSTVETLRQEARQNYEAYQMAMTQMELPHSVVASKTNIKKDTIKSWVRRGISPSKLIPYVQHLLPQSENEKSHFTYQLGIFARKYATKKRDTRILARTFSHEDARQRFKSSIAFFPKILTIDKDNEQTVVQDWRYVKTLDYCFKEAEDHIKTDQQRLEFLRGFIDTSKINPHLESGKHFYQITIDEIKTRSILLGALFELGIYGTENGDTITIKDCCFSQFHNLMIDRNNGNREEINVNMRNVPIDSGSLGIYYTIMKQVDPTKLSQNQAHLEFGTSSKSNIPNWVRKGRKPLVVKRHENLCTRLGLPNIFTTQGLVQRNEKLFYTDDEETYLVSKGPITEPIVRGGHGFIPYKGKVYVVTGEVRDKFLESIGKRKLRTAELEGLTELIDTLTLNRNTVRDIPKTLYPYQRDMKVQVAGVEYTVTNQALRAYFTAYDIQVNPLTHVDTAAISSAVHDGVFGIKGNEIKAKIRDNKVTGLTISTADGADLSDNGFSRGAKNGTGTTILGYDINGQGSEW